MKIIRKNLILFFLLKVTGKYGIEAHKESGHLNSLADMHYSGNIPGNNSLHSTDVRTAGRNKHHGTEMYGSPGSEMGSREHARNNLGANMGLGAEANYNKGNGYGRPGGNLSGEDLGNQKRRLAKQSAAGGLGGPAGGNVGGEKRGARSPAEYGEFGGGRSGSAGRNAAERGDVPQSGSGSGRRGYPYGGSGGELSMAQKEGRGATPYTPELYNSTGMNGGLGGEAVKGRSNLENAIRDRLANELADKAARGDPSAQAALARAGNAYGANNSRPADDQVGNNMADLARKGAAAAEGALKAAASPATGGGEGARRRALNSALRDEEAGRAQARENAKARLGQGKPNAGADQAMGDDLLGARGREAAANGAREGDPSAGKALGRMLKPMNPSYGDEGYRPGGGDTPQNDGDRERQARANKAAKDIAADAYANGMPLGEAVKEGQKGGRAQRVGDEAAANALAAGASPEEAALIGEQAAQNELLDEEMSDSAAMNAIAQQEGYEPVYTEQDFNPPGNSSSERAAAEALKSGADAYEAGEAAEEAEKENERERAKQKAAEQAEEEALRDGATPSEAEEAARRAEERAEMENLGNEEGERAGEAAEAAALADGMPPDEARKAGEQAAAEAKRGFMEGLDNGELEEAAAEEEAEKERERAAAEEDSLNDTYMKAGEAAKQQALADGANYDDAKNLGELAGREAAAKQAGDNAAKKAAADGAGLGKATEAGNAAAKQAYNRNYPPLYDTGDEEAEEKAREEAAKEAGIRERQKAEEGEKEEFEEKSEVEEEEKEKPKMRYTDPEEQYKDGIIGEIPDTADKVDVTEGKMKLPLKTFKSNKPKNEEEADAKKERDSLSDKLRNKITKTPQDSRLNTIDGEYGSYNIPESAKSVDIDDGMLFYPKRAKENMEKQGIDTSPLKPKYNLGERKNIPKGEEYYYVPIKNMKMELPSPFNKSPEPLLTNDDDVVDANDADEIYIKKGKVNLVPWNDYTKKMRPNLYQPDEGIPKERSKIVEGEVITNPSGKQYVRLYPKLGVPEEIPLSDLMKKIKDPLESDENSGQDGISKFSKPEKKKPLASLNVGTNTGTDSKKLEKNYPEKFKETIKENPIIKDIPSDKNAFNKCPKTSIMILKSKDDKEEAKKKCPSNKTFEKLVKKVLAENSNKFSKTLNMDEVRFNSLVKVIPKKVYKVLFDYDCKINDESFKKNYLENVKPLKTIFKSYTDAFIPLIKGAIRVARLRFKPYTITTRIVKKPQTIKFKKYPKMKNIKRNPPLIKKKVKITRPKPITVEKKVIVPVKEVNITKTPSV